MGFLDKAKAAATDLAAKADSALSSTAGSLSGASAGGPSPDALLHDLGLLSFLEATGRPADPQEKERVLAGLRDAEQHGALRSFALRTAVPAAPPPPAGSAPPPPAGSAPPPAGAVPPPPAAPAMPPAEPAAPPPPPSWA